MDLCVACVSLTVAVTLATGKTGRGRVAPCTWLRLRCTRALRTLPLNQAQGVLSASEKPSDKRRIPKDKTRTGLTAATQRATRRATFTPPRSLYSHS